MPGPSAGRPPPPLPPDPNRTMAHTSSSPSSGATPTGPAPTGRTPWFTPNRWFTDRATADPTAGRHRRGGEGTGVTGGRFLRPLVWIGLWVHVALIAFSAVSFPLVVGRPRPDFLPAELWNPIYSWGMAWTGALYIAAGFVAVAAAWILLTGWRRGLLSMGIVLVLGFAVELLGTSTGLPFGPYEYGDMLGGRIAGHVPWSIPLSWFTLLYATLLLGLRLRPGIVGSIVLASLGLVAWDVLMDPGMSLAFPFWEWQVDGWWYGMPLINWAGWFVTGLVMALTVVAIHPLETLRPAAGDRLPAAIFALNGVLPLVLVIMAGLWIPMLVGLAAMGGFLAFTLVGGSLRRHRLAPGTATGSGAPGGARRDPGPARETHRG
ncbi:MAG: carotenoid biosynthesis protein [Gemmatimonadales bacterium]|nr:MAG: carotenoid biosynthesis protein [Gemmatimonadales bacterium]